MRSWIAAGAPAPPISVVSSLVTSTRRARPRSACSMPRSRSIGFMPPARQRRPSVTIACASTVAVVASPAIALVRAATSRIRCAPMFSKRSSSSMLLATSTPELTICGAP